MKKIITRAISLELGTHCVTQVSENAVLLSAQVVGDNARISFEIDIPPDNKEWPVVDRNFIIYKHNEYLVVPSVDTDNVYVATLPFDGELFYLYEVVIKKDELPEIDKTSSIIDEINTLFYGNPIETPVEKPKVDYADLAHDQYSKLRQKYKKDGDLPTADEMRELAAAIYSHYHITYPEDLEKHKGIAIGIEIGLIHMRAIASK